MIVSPPKFFSGNVPAKGGAFDSKKKMRGRYSSKTCSDFLPLRVVCSKRSKESLFKNSSLVDKRQTLFFSPTLQITALKKVEDDENKFLKERAEKERLKKQLAQKQAIEVNGIAAVIVTEKKEKAAEKFVLYNHKKSIHITSVLDSNKRITYIIDSLPSEDAKFLHLTKRISNISQSFGGNYPKIIIFVNRINFADELTKDLTTAGFPADVIHSDLTQKERECALEDFKNGVSKSRILVSVHLCSCGVDIPEMDYVINYNIPDWRHNILEAKNTFLQRCGRTGRIHNGTAITFYVESQDRKSAFWLREVLQNANQEVPDFLKETSGLETFMKQLSVK
uniref:Helicase C-terminal domain-containing protein n=1 Tax=Panagrolaimus davidi TaxID=227884 RepID=A0A914Q3H4_9BILA